MGRRKTSNQVIESNEIAKAKLHPKPDSVWDERIIAQVAASTKDGDTEFHEQSFQLVEFSGARKKLSTLQFGEIKRAVKRLISSYFELTTAHNYTVYPIFAYIRLDDDGTLLAKLNPELKPHYIQLRREFAMRSLPEFRELTSIHSQALFRFLNSWKGLQEATIPLEQLHQALNSSASARKNFKEFRKQILDVAHREINEKTSLFFAWEPVREGLRKVVAIRFVFSATPIVIGTSEKPNGEKDLAGGDALDEHAKLQKSSNACYEKHLKAKQTCIPKRSKKCQFCRERGRMSAKRNNINFAGRGEHETKKAE